MHKGLYDYDITRGGGLKNSWKLGTELKIKFRRFFVRMARVAAPPTSAGHGEWKQGRLGYDEPGPAAAIRPAAMRAGPRPRLEAGHAAASACISPDSSGNRAERVARGPDQDPTTGVGAEYQRCVRYLIGQQTCSAQGLTLNKGQPIQTGMVC